jgi:hypothetical protein
MASVRSFPTSWIASRLGLLPIPIAVNSSVFLPISQAAVLL